MTDLYTVKVVNRTTHALIATLENAEALSLDLILNDVWGASFRMHTTDPDALAYLPEEDLGGVVEVQIWRDGYGCLFWGFPTQGRANKIFVTFDCVGLLGYHARRYFGPIVNHYGTNTDFESGTTGWTAVGGVTFTADTAWRALGTQSAKLITAAADADAYITQSHTTTTTTDPVFFAFKAMFHIVDADWIGPALGERGLYLEVRDEFDVLVGDPVWEPLNENTPRDHSKPVRLETGITVPAGLTNAVVHRRVYSPGGTIYVDATDIATEESVGSDLGGDQAGTILARYHNYSQDPAQGKSDEDIGVNTPDTYTEIFEVQQFFDNANVLDAMKSLADRDLLDFEIGWDPAVADERWLTAWTTKGTYRAGYPIVLDANVVEDFNYDVNAGAITTSARVLGQGEGADREIGLAVDTSDLDGLVLESVADAPADAAIDALQRLADADLAASKAPVIVASFPVPVASILPGVELGDTVDVTANYGWVQQAGTLRIVRISIDCLKDAATVGFNS